MSCRSTSGISQGDCKLSAGDWREIGRIDKLLERDLWIEETSRALGSFAAPPAEVLANSSNPTRKQLQDARFALGLSRYASSTGLDGWRTVPYSAFSVICL